MVFCWLILILWNIILRCTSRCGLKAARVFFLSSWYSSIVGWTDDKLNLAIFITYVYYATGQLNNYLCNIVNVLVCEPRCDTPYCRVWLQSVGLTALMYPQSLPTRIVCGWMGCRRVLMGGTSRAPPRLILEHATNYRTPAKQNVTMQRTCFYVKYLRIRDY